MSLMLNESIFMWKSCSVRADVSIRHDHYDGVALHKYLSVKLFGTICDECCVLEK